MWNINYRYIEPWLDKQSKEVVAGVFDALRLLEEAGPTLGRPLVDSIKYSSIPHLKELRPYTPPGTEIRILFFFDPDRSAVMLVAGDKSNAKSNKLKWNK